MMDFKRLDAILHGSGDGAAALGAHGDHAWLDISWLRMTAGAAQSADWYRGFDGMVDYAAGKGWTNPSDTRLRVHIVRA